MEVREFAADSLEKAVEKAAKHFGVPGDRIDARVLSGQLSVSGIGSRVLILATVRDRSARPETRDRPVRPETRDRPVGPETRDRPVRPETRDRPVGPETRDRPVRPEMRDRSVRPETRDRPVGPEIGETPVELGPTGAFVRELLQRMGFGEGLRVDEIQEAGELIIRVRGDQVRTLARRDKRVHGALAHLANRVAQKVLEPEVIARIDLEADSAGEEHLEEMARSRAREALSEGREVLLPAMDSRERWVVHNALKSVDGIRSESVGTGRLKRVKILPA